MSTKLPGRTSADLVKLLIVIGLAGCSQATAIGQQLNVSIRVVPDGGRVVVEGRVAPATAWSFRDSYGGVVGLGSRIEQFSLLDEEGREVQVRRLAPGHFDATKPAGRFRYEVSLAPPIWASDSATVSWLNQEHALLMLTDLLPVFSSDDKVINGATVKFTLPSAWGIHSNEPEKQSREFNVGDVARAVFVAGARLRTSQINEAGMSFSYVCDGDWAFTDREGLELAGQVLRAHRETFGGMPAKQGMFILLPFPQTAGASQWAAETRGLTVTLLMGKLPSKTAALAQLSTPVTHEFFHLWVPNGLSLDGDYDWFYEGFTVYEAARTAARQGLLTFPEFLNAIGRAYDGYLANADRDRWSLIDASTRRWTGGQTSVYSKSMVIAFMYDLKLRLESHRKKSLEGAYRRIFQVYGSPARGEQTRQPSDGNAAAIGALANEGTMKSFVDKVISKPAAIDLKTELAPFGLVVETSSLRTRISVSDQLTKQQRELLRELGYNDVVRTPRK